MKLICIGTAPGYRLIDVSDGKAVKMVEKFLQNHQLRSHSPHTVRAYAHDLLILYRWLKQEKKKSSLKSLQYDQLFQFIEFQKKKGAHPNSINRRVATCERYYRFCFKKVIPGSEQQITCRTIPGQGKYDSVGIFFHRNIQKSGTARVKAPRLLIEPLELVEIQTLIEKTKRYRDQAIIFLMLHCGLRSCEILRLKLKEVRFDERYLKVKGKGNKERIVPLSDTVVDLMQRYLQWERPRDSATPMFFTVLQGDKRGEAMSAAGLRRLFRYRRFTQKVPRANPHRFRHTFGSNMASAGISLPVLQKIMGHSDIQTTMKYIEIMPGALADSYEKAIKIIEERHQKK